MKAWNTIPIRRRTAFTSTSVAVISTPSNQMRPASIGSRQVDAAQERRLAGAARPDQADDLVIVDHEVDASQDLELPEGLVETLDADASVMRARPLAVVVGPEDQPVVNRASGIVIRTKRNAVARNGVKLKVAELSICALPERLDHPDASRRGRCPSAGR